ncbi:hypothetical protein ACWC09_13005 [Streptomyces sp. NPDC001617]
MATIGFAGGFDSASRFGRAYRRRFGLPPGRDAVRLRAAPRQEPTAGSPTPR